MIFEGAEKMKNSRARKQVPLMAMALLWVLIPSASAVTFETHYIGGDAPANSAGGGNLPEIVNAAARIWESAYSDPLVIHLYYGWADVGDAGTHMLQQSDFLDREISGMILFDNSGAVQFYLDPTPNSNEEYRRRTEEYQDLGGGFINVARLFSSPVNEASGRVDLLSVALHEIGHALGLSSGNTRFLRQSADGLLVLSSAPGTVIPLACNNSGVVPHFDPQEVLYGPVMSGTNGDERRIPSELDVLANAQVSGFTIAALDPWQASLGTLSKTRALAGARTGGTDSRARPGNRAAVHSVSTAPLQPRLSGASQ